MLCEFTWRFVWITGIGEHEKMEKGTGREERIWNQTQVTVVWLSSLSGGWAQQIGIIHKDGVLLDEVVARILQQGRY